MLLKRFSLVNQPRREKFLLSFAIYSRACQILQRAFAAYNIRRHVPRGCHLVLVNPLPEIEQCTPKELSEFLKAFRKIADAFQPVQSPADVGFTSVILNEIIVALPKLRDIVRGLLGDINLAKAAENDMMELWTDPEKYPDIEETQMVS